MSEAGAKLFFGSASAPLPPLPPKKMAPAPHPWKKGMIYRKHIENNRNIFKVVFEVMAGQSNFHLTAKKNNQECIEIRAEGPFPRPLLFNR